MSLKITSVCVGCGKGSVKYIIKEEFEKPYIMKVAEPCEYLEIVDLITDDSVIDSDDVVISCISEDGNKLTTIINQPVTINYVRSDCDV